MLAFRAFGSWSAGPICSGEVVCVMVLRRSKVDPSGVVQAIEVMDARRG